MRRFQRFERSFPFVMAACAAIGALHCSGSSSGSGAPGNTAAFVGSWNCTLNSTAEYSEPPGTPPHKSTDQQTETLTKIGANELADGGDCPSKYRVSGHTATSEPQATCTTADGNTISDIATTITLSGGTLHMTERATIRGTASDGTKVVATVSIVGYCEPGVANGDAGTSGSGGESGSGGSANSAGGRSGGSGGSANSAGGVNAAGGRSGGSGGSINSSGGALGNGGASAGGASSGGAAAVDAGGVPCGSYMGTPELGTCMPESAAPPLNTLYWSQDTCPTGELCVATTKAVNPSSKFAPCGTAADPGACWPSYVLEDSVVGAGAFFPQGSCRVGEECAPCTNTTVPTLMFCND